MMGIYCLTNKVNNKKYFGQSTDIEQRKKDYFNYGRFPNDHLKNAFNKYGKENFEFKIIKCCKEKYLDRFEKLYIQINDTINQDKGYNKDSGGNLNKYHSPETRKKMSEIKSGENNPMWDKKHSKETRKKISEALTGITRSEETKKKISESHIGKTLSKEHKKKISENSPYWKDYPRIILAGKDKNGKQQYKINYNGKKFAQSIYKDKLYAKWYDEYPDIELVDETI